MITSLHDWRYCTNTDKRHVAYLQFQLQVCSWGLFSFDKIFKTDIFQTRDVNFWFFSPKDSNWHCESSHIVVMFGLNEHNSVTGEENKSQNWHVKSNFNNNKNCFRLLQLWFTFDFMHTKKHNGLACPKSRTLFQYCLLKYSVICVSWTKSHKAIEVADIAPCAGKSRVRIAKSWRHLRTVRCHSQTALLLWLAICNVPLCENTTSSRKPSVENTLHYRHKRTEPALQ